jgi:hypothetical protein
MEEILSPSGEVNRHDRCLTAQLPVSSVSFSDISGIHQAADSPATGDRCPGDDRRDLEVDGAWDDSFKTTILSLQLSNEQSRSLNCHFDRAEIDLKFERKTETNEMARREGQ